MIFYFFISRPRRKNKYYEEYPDPEKVINFAIIDFNVLFLSMTAFRKKRKAIFYPIKKEIFIFRIFRIKIEKMKRNRNRAARIYTITSNIFLKNRVIYEKYAVSYKSLFKIASFVNPEVRFITKKMFLKIIKQGLLLA